jgi:subtilisin family serine protease
MKTLRTLALLLGLLYLCFFGHLACVSALVASEGAGAGGAAPLAPDYVVGEVLVQFRAVESWDSVQFTTTLHGLELAQRFEWLSAHQGQVICLLRSPTQTTAALIAELSQDPTVALVEPNYLRWPSDMRTPNDPRFGQLWGLRNSSQAINGVTGTAHADIGFLSAWGLARPSTNEVVVAVIDTGLDLTHPDIVSNLWTNPGEIPNNGLDDDGNGYVDDVHGYDFVNGTGAVTDAGFHGTHVSGTIAASGNNGLGVIGVDFQAHIMGLRVSSDGTVFDSAAIIEALQYAAMMKTRGENVVAVNASYGGGSYSSTESTAIQAAGDVGIIFCAAAGNDAANNDLAAVYPANYRLSNMIVIAASDQNDALATFSDYGATTVDLAAPGVNILSCVPVSQPGNSSYVQQASAVYQANALTYSGLTTSNGITAAIYYCGLGYPTNFPAAVSNNIALIQRGTFFFSDKVSNAMAAGAQAAVIFNNVAGNVNSATLQTAGNWIPAITLSQADGQALLAALPASGTLVNVPDPANIYQLLDGTSMAAPHVAGAVAFTAMNFPAETVTQRIQRLLANVTPVAGLAGKVAMGGRLNLARSVDTDGNGLPDWWEQQFFGHLTGTDPNADPDHDGASNLAEYLAGTDPTSFNSALRLTALRAADTNGVVLEWPSVMGRYYRLQRATNLFSGFDSLVLTNLAATPPLNTATDTALPSAGPRYYRLELEP